RASVELFGIGRGKSLERKKDPVRDPGPQAGAVSGLDRALELGAGTAGLDVLRSQGYQLVDQERFHGLGRRREELHAASLALPASKVVDSFHEDHLDRVVRAGWHLRAIRDRLGGSELVSVEYVR